MIRDEQKTPPGLLKMGIRAGISLTLFNVVLLKLYAQQNADHQLWK